MSRFSLEEVPPRNKASARRATVDYSDIEFTTRRKHEPIGPQHKVTQKEIEYRQNKTKQNEEAAKKLNRTKNTVMTALENEAKSKTFTGKQYKEAVDAQVEKDLDKWRDYKKGIRSLVTAAELGLSGASLLGAYANWRNWATATSATKQLIANLLQKAQAPMQVGGTLIDSYQTYDAATQHNDFDKYYNAGSTMLGSAGYVGASDVFRGRYPKLDRLLDVMGILQNAGDYVKFGYDMFNNNNIEGGDK